MSELFGVKELVIDEWELYWGQVSQANLLQSWQYGAAKEETEGWRAIRFLISDTRSRPVAISQALTKSLPLIGGVARINRGPLFLQNQSAEQFLETCLSVFQALFQEARLRRWWVVQIAPELPESKLVIGELNYLRLHRRPGFAWASARLALDADENDILMGFNGKWRNCMRKGIRLGVTVTHHDGSGPELELLIRHYTALQKDKNFDGLPEKMIKSLARQSGDRWKFNLFIACEATACAQDEPIGMLVTIRHGDTATYLIGTTNDRGRQMQANSVLLWQAILHTKEAGCKWFDIGGLNSTTPKGVAEFKKGVNAVPYALVGEWRYYCLPCL